MKLKLTFQILLISRKKVSYSFHNQEVFNTNLGEIVNYAQAIFKKCYASAFFK